MRVEISDSLLRSIVNALHEMPYKVAAPALEELQKAINDAQKPQPQVEVPSFLKRNGPMRAEGVEGSL